MPTLLTPPDLAERLGQALRRAGPFETGGVMVGEQVRPGEFRLMDLSIQGGGGPGHFVRRPEAHQAFLDDFFERTDWDFERFNYLGEWHSHPCFPVRPSPEDRRGMNEIVTDEAPLAPDFALLMICRLTRAGAVRASATAFLRDGRTAPVRLRLSNPKRPDR
jgi:hypothetical protein